MLHRKKHVTWGMKSRAREMRSIKVMLTHCVQKDFTHFMECHHALCPNKMPQHHILEPACAAEGHCGLRLHLESIVSAQNSLQRILVI